MTAVSRRARARAHILAYPEEFDMGAFCGSRYCVGGTAALLFTEADPRNPDEPSERIAHAAADALGFTFSQACYLFYGTSEDFERLSESRAAPVWNDLNDGTAEHAAHGAAWIDGFVERHGTAEERAAYAAGLPAEAA